MLETINIKPTENHFCWRTESKFDQKNKKNINFQKKVLSELFKISVVKENYCLSRVLMPMYLDCQNKPIGCIFLNSPDILNHKKELLEAISKRFEVIISDRLDCIALTINGIKRRSLLFINRKSNLFPESVKIVFETDRFSLGNEYPYIKINKVNIPVDRFDNLCRSKFLNFLHNTTEENTEDMILLLKKLNELQLTQVDSSIGSHMLVKDLFFISREKDNKLNDPEFILLALNKAIEQTKVSSDKKMLMLFKQIIVEEVFPDVLDIDCLSDKKDKISNKDIEKTKKNIAISEKEQQQKKPERIIDYLKNKTLPEIDVIKVLAVIDGQRDIEIGRFSIKHLDADENNLLHYACFVNSFDIAYKLIKAGINVNHKNKNGFTPLMMASSRGAIDIAKLLIDNGANIQAKDKSDNDASYYAKLSKMLDMLAVLEDYNPAMPFRN